MGHHPIDTNMVCQYLASFIQLLEIVVKEDFVWKGASNIWFNTSKISVYNIFHLFRVYSFLLCQHHLAPQDKYVANADKQKRGHISRRSSLAFEWLELNLCFPRVTTQTKFASIFNYSQQWNVVLVIFISEVWCVWWGLPSAHSTQVSMSGYAIRSVHRNHSMTARYRRIPNDRIYPWHVPLVSHVVQVV